MQAVALLHGRGRPPFPGCAVPPDRSRRPCALPAHLLSRLAPPADLFKRPAWVNALLLLTGTLLAPGRRTVAAALRILGHEDVAEIGSAFRTLSPLLGPAAAGIFLVSLLASGLSSSAVGTMAGQMIMQGFVGFAIPVWVRRLVTMLPAFAVVALGVDSTKALVMSQVVLSFVLPLPMVALVWFTRRRDIVGRFANARLVDAAAVAGTAIIVALNVVLILLEQNDEWQLQHRYMTLETMAGRGDEPSAALLKAA